MKSQPFEAIVRFRPETAIIDMGGEINAFAESDLMAAYQKAEAQDPGTVILNFSDVTYINSTGIALIVSLLAQARKSHKHLVVINLSDHYIEIFQITRLSDYMKIYPDETSAMQAAQE